MLIKTCIEQSSKKLEQAGVGTSRLDVLVLLEDITGIDRSRLLANPDTQISAKQLAKLTKLLRLRAQHLPLAYIRGRTEFYGREFIITSSVLEPRPESETMIDLLKTLPGQPTETHIADVGAGSGALGITTALELPNSHVELLEISQAAWKVAKTNVDKFTLNISVIKSDLLTHSRQHNDILLCNLPYVPDSFQINPAAMREPKIAIFGGPDGLDIYRRLFTQVSTMKKQPLYILTEALPPQHSALQTIANRADYTLHKSEDFIQVFKN